MPTLWFYIKCANRSSRTGFDDPSPIIGTGYVDPLIQANDIQARVRIKHKLNRFALLLVYYSNRSIKLYYAIQTDRRVK